MSDLITEKQPYLEALKKRVLIFDGAMGTNLEYQGLSDMHFGGAALSGCNDNLNLTFPSAVETVHRSFLEAGVDVIETNTFRSNRFTLNEFGLGEKTRRINYVGAKLARCLADTFSSIEKPRYVAGSIGPSGILLSLGQKETATGFDSLRTAFREQAAALIEGGVDLLLLETQQDILEVKAAIIGIQDAFNLTGKALPIQVQVTLDANGRMLLGTDIRAVITILEEMGIDILGINCSTGPDLMRGALGVLKQFSHLPISCLPNAGLPENINGKAVYPLQRDKFAEIMDDFVKTFGLNVVGGCCGTTPEHLRLLVNSINNRAPIRKILDNIACLASPYSSVEMRQTPAPLIIGERLNTQGSRNFKDIMLQKNYDSAVQIARDQVEKGAHALDICTALTEDSQEAERMVAVISLLSGQVDAPVVIDSTDITVMEAALKSAPGRCVLNSINLESGESKARLILALAKQFNTAVIALTIDENGMAKTSTEKIKIARRIYKLAVEGFGLKAQDLIFDPLTFTLASGSPDIADAGLQTLEGVRLIKEALPGVFTCLGVSNISFGLNPAARMILNSVFLYHALQNGLDMAILNPSQVIPLPQISENEKRLAEELLFNRNTLALSRFASFFQKSKSGSPGESVPRITQLRPEDRIMQRILIREKDGITDDIDLYVKSGDDHHNNALELLNQSLLPAMKIVGEQFGRGELILPFVLQSAEVMRAATDHLEKYLAKTGSQKKGRLILATVYGDVHDIGKNLVGTILANNGYEVVDLGKQVAVETIVSRAVEINADAIGLSALLVSTSQQMPLVVEELSRRGLSIPVLVGGAAINPAFAERIERLSDGSIYAGKVTYCKDAFDALNALDHSGRITKSRAKMGENPPQPAPEVKSVPVLLNAVAKAKIPVPPFWGYQKVPTIPIEELFGLINLSALFRISWGASNAKGEKWEKFQESFKIRLAEMREKLEFAPWLNASALYGYYVCYSEADNLIIIPPSESGIDKPIRFPLPRQKSEARLSLCDYFASEHSGQADTAAFQLVTLGHPSTEFVHKLQEAGNITDAYFHHGLAVQLTEAAAIWVHQRIRRELQLGARQGKRYSWGYPAIPDLSQHRDVFKILPAERELGLRLTSAYQFVPEYTTAALVVHHPDAAYFKIE